MTKKLITQVTIEICRQIMQQCTQLIIFSLNYILTVVQWKILPHSSNNKKAQLTGDAKPRQKFPQFEVITSSSQVGNPVFIIINFFIQITSTYSS